MLDAITLLAFTNRQLTVLNLVSKGLSNKEIGNMMLVTEATVKYHITVLNKKLKSKTRVQLAIWYFANVDKLPEIIEATRYLPKLAAAEPSEVTLPRKRD